MGGGRLPGIGKYRGDYLDLRTLRAAPQRPPAGFTRLFVSGADGDAYQLEADGTQTALAGGGGGTASEGFLSGDVSMPSVNTFYDGPSLSLAAGTYVLWGVADVTIGSDGAGFITAKLWDGTNVLETNGAYLPASGAESSIPVTGTIVLGSTTTVKISCAATVSGATNSKIKTTAGNNGDTNKASHLVALKIA